MCKALEAFFNRHFEGGRYLVGTFYTLLYSWGKPNPAFSSIFLK